ncbi:hypothetical protein Sviol_60110 [Streptomyces violascens]|uniref:Uncharacterized protein n=1 Tax=Streptomyces violascens TaxID=67381 RepID=A0ABQ3QWD9_9ACTN|nr:hypothetical protein Sviol_60110 [Streptomyces violascens]
MNHVTKCAHSDQHAVEAGGLAARRRPPGGSGMHACVRRQGLHLTSDGEVAVEGPKSVAPKPTKNHVARAVEGAQRTEWRERAMAAHPPYAEYQHKTDRQIPFVLDPK